MQNDNHYDFSLQFELFSRDSITFWVIKMETFMMMMPLMPMITADGRFQLRFRAVVVSFSLEKFMIVGKEAARLSNECVDERKR